MDAQFLAVQQSAGSFNLIRPAPHALMGEQGRLFMTDHAVRIEDIVRVPDGLHLLHDRPQFAEQRWQEHGPQPPVAVLTAVGGI